MADPFSIAAIALVGIGTVAKTASENEANDARMQALKLREEQEAVAAKEKSLQRTTQLTKIIATQQAQAGARGIDTSSPSYLAITQDSFNQWAQDERTGSMNTEMSREGYESEIGGLKMSNMANIFGAVTDFGGDVFGAMSGGGLLGSTKLRSSRSALTPAQQQAQDKQDEQDKQRYVSGL